MTNHALFHAPGPVNEPNLTYAPGTPERAQYEQARVCRGPGERGAMRPGGRV